MQKISAKDILDKGQEMTKSRKDWHFHILTPDCQLNSEKQYALVLETSEEVFICYSSQPEMDTGKQLVQLLQGRDVVSQNQQASEQLLVSPDVEKILSRVKDMNAKGQFWHHHMLFPFCTFNKHQGKWTIVFEDLDNKEILESVSDKEPKADLKQIESLFYQQNK
ncbi:MAG: hypothetical protein M1120_02345 [Patescibacteria group bacterium]|nr:hypothetical protein [Patescibacteria group bacterium]